MTSRARKTYHTRIDEARARLGLGPSEWAAEALMSRPQLLRYRQGRAEPHVENLAKLVRAARRMSGARVKASDFYDLREDEPVNPKRARYVELTNQGEVKTRLEALLRREGVRPTHLARQAAMSRQVCRRLREDKADMMVSTLGRIVKALRRMGLDVKAADVADVGED